MPVNLFPCTRAAALRELSALRLEITAIDRERAELANKKNGMLIEAFEIERNLIVDLMTEPPSAVIKDLNGDLWQRVGTHLRKVPKAEANKTVQAAPLPAVTAQERFREEREARDGRETSDGRCGCQNCQGFTGILAHAPGLFVLANEECSLPATNGQTEYVVTSDRLSAARRERVQAHGRLREECGGAAANGHQDIHERDC